MFFRGDCIDESQINVYKGLSIVRVLLVNNYGYIRGGSDRLFLDTGALLSKNGIEVDYFVPRDDRNIVSPCCSFTGIDTSKPRIDDIPSFFYSKESKKVLRDYLTRRKPDIAHLHIYYGRITASILAALRNHEIPIVQTLHEYKIHCPVSTSWRNQAYCKDCAGGRYWNCVRYCCNRKKIGRSILSALESCISDRLGANSLIDRYIAVSDFQRQLMIEAGLRADKVVTIPNFVPDNVYKNNRSIGSYFLYFGRIETVKGIGTLIDAMRRIPDVNLLLVGDGSDKDYFERVAIEGCLQNIRFLGHKTGDELRALIAGAICTVVPSEWNETFGLVLIESFAQCRPVVASRLGAMTEIVSHGKDGLLFDAKDVTGLAKALRWMADNREYAVEMGVNGQKKVKDLYSEERYFKSLINVYQETMHRS